MSTSFTTEFTRTDARYATSKIAADLRAMQDHYGKPDEDGISDYCTEMDELLLEGCVESVQYGFKRDGKKVLVLEYKILPSGLFRDDRSGGVPADVDVSGAKWFSFLIYNDYWYDLSEEEQDEILERIPVDRSVGQEPQDGDGYWEGDKSYSSSGRGTQRRTFRPGRPA